MARRRPRLPAEWCEVSVTSSHRFLNPHLRFSFAPPPAEGGAPHQSLPPRLPQMIPLKPRHRGQRVRLIVSVPAAGSFGQYCRVEWREPFRTRRKRHSQSCPKSAKHVGAGHSNHTPPGPGTGHSRICRACSYSVRAGKTPGRLRAECSAMQGQDRTASILSRPSPMAKPAPLSLAGRLPAAARPGRAAPSVPAHGCTGRGTGSPGRCR